MTYKTMKVFDSCLPPGNMPDYVYEVSRTLNSDLWSHGNDSYYPFEIVAKPKGEEQGLGWISDEEACILTDWLREQGAEVGETVLVKHWW